MRFARSRLVPNLLWEALRGRKFLGLKVRRQHAIGMMILDFYCPEHWLAIEVDGGIHNEPEHRKNDIGRDELLLTERGIRTLRVTAEDVEANMPKALKRIQVAVTVTAPGPPLHRNGEGLGVR